MLASCESVVNTPINEDRLYLLDPDKNMTFYTSDMLYLRYQMGKVAYEKLKDQPIIIRLYEESSHSLKEIAILNNKGFNFTTINGEFKINIPKTRANFEDGVLNEIPLECTKCRLKLSSYANEDYFSWSPASFIIKSKE